MADYNPYGTGNGNAPWQKNQTQNPALDKAIGSVWQFLTGTTPNAGAVAKFGTTQAGPDAVEQRRLAALKPKTGTSTTSTDANEARRLANLAAQAKLNAQGGANITPANSQIIKNLGGGAQKPTGGFTADMLFQDATSAYQPILDLYNKQQQQLQDRYAANAADIKNIFGNLTTVRAQDKAKIAQQFKTSIEQQQAALAGRTAEARAGVAAGQQGAATAAAEMGTAGQPAPSDSLTAQAAEQGIADSNAYQTTWSALQNVMSQQAQNDVQNAVQGYDYQQTAALETLRNNLEDRLAAIQANMAGTQSDIAGAQLAGKQNVLNAKYAESQAQQAAAAKAAAAAASAAAKGPTYSKDMFGLQQRAAAAKISFTDIQKTANEAFDSAFALLNPAGSTKVTTPKKADILNAWNAIKAGSPQTANKLAPYVNAYVGYTYKN